MRVDNHTKVEDLDATVEKIFLLAAEKSKRLTARWKEGDGAPVFTVRGKYTSRGWTEWTQGFQFGIPLILGYTLKQPELFDYAERMIVQKMPVHLTHRGVHDHGFNNVSTFGMMLRLMAGGIIPEETWKRRYLELALRVSGAVQASRWTRLPENLGYIYSFNGPHSLFAVPGARLEAGPGAHGGTGYEDQSSVPTARARRGNRPLQRLSRRRPGPLGREGQGGARIDIQYRQWKLPFAFEPARLFAIHYMDERPGLGHARVCRGAGVSRLGCRG